MLANLTVNPSRHFIVGVSRPSSGPWKRILAPWKECELLIQAHLLQDLGFWGPRASSSSALRVCTAVCPMGLRPPAVD